jgi:hypothetical protein
MHRLKCIETPAELRQHVYRKQRIMARLRLATAQVEEAQQERTWAIAAAHKAGLSIRQISTATGLSSSYLIGR